MVYSGSSELDLSAKFKMSISVESYEKTAENYGYCYVARKAHNFQAVKDINPKF